jgi:hypothetical protein
MLSVMKTEERRRARELRELGWSITEIEREVGVSRASVSVWVRDISLDDEAQQRLIERTGKGPAVAAVLKASRARELRLAHQEEGRRLARERDALYAIGCMLHWAEGDKCRNSVRMSNSDPELLALFVHFLQHHFDVRPEQFCVCCNLFADHIDRQHDIEQFWLERLGLPQSSLRKSVINVYSKHSRKKRQNKLPYGTCKLYVHSTRIQQTIYGSIQEYGGFERPEWLD